MNYINSKFKFLPIFLVSYITVLPFLVVYLSYKSPKASIVLPVILLLFIVTFWLTVIRTRANKVIIEKNNIVVKRYFGLGKAMLYSFNEFDGFITIFENGKLGVSESLFLIKNGKRTGSISSFYHKNFEDLKTIFFRYLIDLGEKESTFRNESSELFKK